MKTVTEINKEEYIALRSEILQSIDKQHQIMIGGYLLTATIFGYIISKGTEPVWQALAIIPFASLGMTALWAVEANRMVRASYYIAHFLWPQFARQPDVQGLTSWEAWIRSRHGIAGQFGKLQDRLQMVVTSVMPMLASNFAMLVVTYHSWHKEPRSLFICWIVLWVFILSLWSLLIRWLRPISCLSMSNLAPTQQEVIEALANHAVVQEVGSSGVDVAVVSNVQPQVTLSVETGVTAKKI
jgi:hypothetical protein